MLDWNKVKCSLQLKRSQRDSNHLARQSEQHTTWTSFSTDTNHSTSVPLQANLWTWSHAQSGLAAFAFHFCAFSSGDKSIRATRRNRWFSRVILASLTASNPSPQFQIDSYPEVVERCKWNRPFTRGGQLLTLRERGSSPLAWLDEYKLTYSPSPPSSFALSLYGKRGGTQTQA